MIRNVLLLPIAALLLPTLLEWSKDAVFSPRSSTYRRKRALHLLSVYFSWPLPQTEMFAIKKVSPSLKQKQCQLTIEAIRVTSCSIVFFALTTINQD